MKSLTVGVVLVSVSVLTACPQASAPPAGEAERRAFLASLTDSVMLPHLERLEIQAGALVDATTALEATSGTDDAARATAREALVTLQTTWQALEVMHIGPAGSPATPLAGNRENTTATFGFVSGLLAFSPVFRRTLPVNL